VQQQPSAAAHVVMSADRHGDDGAGHWNGQVTWNRGLCIVWHTVAGVQLYLGPRDFAPPLRSESDMCAVFVFGLDLLAGDAGQLRLVAGR
jgi:hypothetical protein